MTFDEMKKTCEEKAKRAKQLYSDRAQEVIFKDIREYMGKYPDEIKKRKTDYIYNNKIILGIYDDYMEIDDRRGTSYCWLFEVDSDYLVTDIFEYEGRPVSVKNAENPEMETEIRNIIEKYNLVIEYLSKNPITNYTYFSSEPEVRVDNFEDVLKTVLMREPVIF